MARFSNKAVFGGALLVGILFVLGSAAYSKLAVANAAETVRVASAVKQLTSAISVSEQLTPDQLKGVNHSGFTTVIDLRPDGEVAGQPDAAAMEAEAKANGLAFVYVPVPHGDIPDSAVEALGKALDAHRGPVLMYCRSGKRAARTWSLVEASRSGGMQANEILEAVKASGQSADDLRPAIEARIAKRGSKQMVAK